MRGIEESDDDFHDRFKRAEAHADKTQGQTLDPTAWLVGAFFAGSMPAYFALLLAGFHSDSLQIPLISAGLALSAITYLLIRERQKRWLKVFQQYLEQTKPE